MRDYMELKLDNPLKDLTTPEALGAVAAAFVAFVAMLRKWLLRDRSDIVRVKHEERQGNAEERVDATYEGILAYLRASLAENAIERAQIRAELAECSARHARCDEEVRGLRSRIEQLERKT